MSIIWEEPTVSLNTVRPRKDWAAVAAELKTAPGQWAIIDTDAPTSMSANFKKGLNKSFRPVGEWGFTVRGADQKGRAEKVFGRYVGQVPA